MIQIDNILLQSDQLFGQEHLDQWIRDH